MATSRHNIPPTLKDYMYKPSTSYALWFTYVSIQYDSFHGSQHVKPYSEGHSQKCRGKTHLQPCPKPFISLRFYPLLGEYQKMAEN